jgi:hypothetical protein
MCRNIKKLRDPQRPPTDEEITLAALQFVRKVSGYQKPSRANEAAFEQAIAEVAAATRKLFDHLQSKQGPFIERGVAVGLPQQYTTNEHPY